MKELTKNFVPRIFCFVLGLLMITLGVSLAYKARGNGTSAYDALNHAVAYDFNLTKGIPIPIGTWIIIVGILCILIAALIMKRMPQLLSVITIFITGGFIQLWTTILNSEHEITEILPSILCTAGGILLISIGIALYLLPRYPAAPIELITLALVERFKWSFGLAKFVQELVTMAIAFLLGGPIWFGTIAFTFLLGPMIQFWMKPFNVFYGKIVK